MNSNELTAEELFHFALYASQNHRTDDSIKYLKALLQLSPDNAQVHFLIGSQYAEIQLVDLGIKHVSTALKLAPEIDLIRFQLAMLFFSTNKIEEAKETLTPLLVVPKDNPFYFLGHGLTSLTNGDNQTAISMFQSALSMDLNNQPLAENVKLFIKNIQLRQDSNETEVSSKAESAQHNDMFLSVYKK